MAEEYRGIHGKLIDRLGAKWPTRAHRKRFSSVRFQATSALPEPGAGGIPLLRAASGQTSSPRNTLIGHFVAILAGALSLALFGLLDHPSVLQEGVTLVRVGAAAFSVALTGAVLILLRSSHAPTGATVLIVSLGLLQTPREMVMLVIGIVILIVVGWIINRALGVPMPIWVANG
ncbi:MAG: HPP family protein [Actinobacteria bacterium]|nr:HPP family protein [Actinomycetota bacterium]